MIRKAAGILFVLMAAVGLIGWTITACRETVNQQDHWEAVCLANAPAASLTNVNACTDSETYALRSMDIEALRKVNADVIGWIRIPDTQIDYPLLKGEDNEYYLKHNWKHNATVDGAVFMEHENAADFSDFNTIIYGHNMRSGAMFGGLKAYRSRDYWEEHPYMYIVHDGGVFRYDIFAAHEVQTGDITYAIRIKKTERRADCIRFSLENSQIDTGISPAPEDHLLTLSTCTGDPGTRWVVQGVLNAAQSCAAEIP